MKFKITPREIDITIEADSAEEAMAIFAAEMDSDMNIYFSATKSLTDQVPVKQINLLNVDGIISVSTEEYEKLLIGEDSDQYRNHNIYTETPEEFYFQNEERQRITDAIRELDITSQRYIARRFFESDKKQRRFTAKYFGIAPALAKEIEKDALEELKDILFPKNAQ